MPLNRKNRISNKKKMFKTKNKWNIATDFILNSVITDRLNEVSTSIKNNSGAGCTCRKCDNYNEYAEPNQVDGTFLCFSCRSMG